MAPPWGRWWRAGAVLLALTTAAAAGTASLVLLGWLLWPSGTDDAHPVVDPPVRRADPLARELRRVEGLTYVNDLDLYLVSRGQVVRLTSTGLDGDPAWSPDGARVAFVSARSGSTSDVFVMDVTTGHTVRLTTTERADEFGVAWDPGGRRLAFSLRYAHGYAIGLMNADGSHRRIVWRAGDGAVGLTDWSPDGRTLLLQYDPEGSGNADLYELDVRTRGEPRRLTTDTGLDWNGRYSPDGSRIAYQCAGLSAICTVGVGGRAPVPLVRLPGHVSRVQLDWSPDGSRLAWTGRSAQATLPLQVTDLRSGANTAVTSALATPSAVAWRAVATG